MTRLSRSQPSLINHEQAIANLEKQRQAHTTTLTQKLASSSPANSDSLPSNRSADWS